MKTAAFTHCFVTMKRSSPLALMAEIRFTPKRCPVAGTIGVSPFRAHVGRIELQRQESLPIQEPLRTRADELRPLPLGKLMRRRGQYPENQCSKLLVPFEKDGRLEIDTGAAERRLRRVATGRRAWLFAVSTNGAVRIAATLRLVSTAEAAGIAPGRYVTDIYLKIADDWPQSRLEELRLYRSCG